MNSNIKVSVIIPVYEVENYLERAIDSALAQTLEKIEIILVDDGSPDTSPQICDRYAAAFPDKIRVIHKENEGLGLARNAGVQIARGEYVAFLDFDDSVEPDMYERLYEKAVEEDDDIVMCDVKIIYVDENRTSVVSTYPHETIDLPDYLAHGNNITYSVNKLYRREIWEENRYEKMVFEDIALIPALVTKYSRIGYVPEPFYHYYRRSNTLSTAPKGSTSDIVRAFRSFIENADPAYREEVIYCVSRQLYWNMTQSRTLFLPDFITLIRTYESDFRLNPYLEKDKNTRQILDFLKRDVIPETIICAHFGEALPQEYLDAVHEHFPNARLLEAEDCGDCAHDFPPSVQRALAEGNLEYAEEYVSLRMLYAKGGIVLRPNMRVSLALKHLRLNRAFFGFEDQETICSGCFGAVAGHYAIQALLDSYNGDSIFNRALLPLGERLRDFLIVRFGLKPNGHTQRLKGDLQVYLPSVLAYDMQNGENACKIAVCPVPEGYEVVSRHVLAMWSDRLMENWNLYKREKQARQATGGKAPPPMPKQQTASPSNAAQIEREVEARVRQVVETYENSTCWRITRPLRMIAGWFDR